MADRHVICANRRRHALLLTTAVVFAAIGVWILFDVGLRVYRRLTGAPVTIAITHLDRSPDEIVRLALRFRERAA